MMLPWSVLAWRMFGADPVAAWNFIVSLLAGAGAAIVIGLIFIGRYQQKVDALEKSSERTEVDLKAILNDLGFVKGELSRINGRH